MFNPFYCILNQMQQINQISVVSNPQSQPVIQKDPSFQNITVTKLNYYDTDHKGNELHSFSIDSDP